MAFWSDPVPFFIIYWWTIRGTFGLVRHCEGLGNVENDVHVVETDENIGMAEYVHIPRRGSPTFSAHKK